MWRLFGKARNAILDAQESAMIDPALEAAKEEARNLNPSPGGEVIFTTELRWVESPDRLEVKCVRADGTIEWRKCPTDPDQP